MCVYTHIHYFHFIALSSIQLFHVYYFTYSLISFVLLYIYMLFKIYQRGVQWKQGVVIYMMLYTSFFI